MSLVFQVNKPHLVMVYYFFYIRGSQFAKLLLLISRIFSSFQIEILYSPKQFSASPATYFLSYEFAYSKY